MKSKQLLLILPFIAALTGCGQSGVTVTQSNDASVATSVTATPPQLIVYPNDRPSIPDGKPVFAQNCASCHTGASTDATATAGAGGKAGGGFSEEWARQTKPVDIYRIVAFGWAENHPKFNAEHKHEAFSGKLSVRELWDVVSYTKNLGEPALTDVQIAEVDPVFGSNCAVCHGTKGDGDGPLARNLDPMPANFQRFDRFYNRTDDVLFDHIANGIRWEGMPNFLGKQDKKKNVKFDEPYIRKLVAYVHKFHLSNEAVLTAHAAAPAPNPGGEAGAGPGAGTEVGTQADTAAPAPLGKPTGKPASSQKATDAKDNNAPAANDNNSTNKVAPGER